MSYFAYFIAVVVNPCLKRFRFMLKSYKAILFQIERMTYLNNYISNNSYNHINYPNFIEPNELEKSTYVQV